MMLATRFRSSTLLVGAVIVALPSASVAQATTAPGVTRSYVQVVRLRPEKVTEWMALQRNEVIPAQKKAGVASRTTLVTQVGNGFEYVSITPFPDWSAMDGDAVLTRALGAEGAAALNAKLRQCIQSSSWRTAEIRRGASRL